MKKQEYLLRGIIFSVLIFLLLLILRCKAPCLLDIDAKWIILSGLPILLALILGGYVKSFKGWGVEIELQSPIYLFEDASVATNRAEVLEKSSLQNLNNLSPDELNRINIISFRTNRVDYYTRDAIGQYVLLLRNLKYAEILDNNGNFKYLIPISLIRRVDIVENFIRLLERDNIESRFPPNVAVSVSITKETTVLETLRKMRKNNVKFIPVLKDRRVEAVVEEEKINSLIVAEVLKKRESKEKN